MNFLFKTISNALAVIGVLLILGGIGTSDYYTMELGQTEPSSVWTTLMWGFILIVPTLIHSIYTYYKE